jgi:hypothetical protein
MRNHQLFAHQGDLHGETPDFKLYKAASLADVAPHMVSLGRISVALLKEGGNTSPQYIFTADLRDGPQAGSLIGNLHGKIGAFTLITEFAQVNRGLQQIFVKTGRCEPPSLLLLRKEDEVGIDQGDRLYYVTAKREDGRAPTSLLGPFESHLQALMHQRAVAAMAGQRFPVQAPWSLYETISVERDFDGALPRGLLNDDLLSSELTEQADAMVAGRNLPRGQALQG